MCVCSQQPFPSFNNENINKKHSHQQLFVCYSFMVCMCLLTMPLEPFQEWKKSRFAYSLSRILCSLLCTYSILWDAHICAAECARCAHFNRITRTHKWFLPSCLPWENSVRNWQQIPYSIQWDFNRPTTFVSHTPFRSKVKLYAQHTYTNKPHTFRKRHVVLMYIFQQPFCGVAFAISSKHQNKKIFSLRCRCESYCVSFTIIAIKLNATPLLRVNRHYKNQFKLRLP